MKDVALALGGGGARGLGHLKILEALDRAGIRISKISGSSIGAIVGALYASGKSAIEIQEDVHQFLILKDDRKRDVVRKLPRMFSWLSLLSLDVRKPGVARIDIFLKKFLEDLERMHIEDLPIPLTVVTTDYWTGEEVAITSGPLLPAIMASSAIPGIFQPVKHQGRILVDGSLANPVPFSHVIGEDVLSIAVDIAPLRDRESKDFPKTLEATEGMFDVFFDRLVEYKLQESPPTIYHRPGIRNVGLMEFDKADRIYTAIEDSLPDLKRKCKQHGLRL